MTVARDFTERAASLSILYLGRDWGTSGHRAASLVRLGHNVRVLTPERLLPTDRLTSYWTFHTGALGLGKLVRTRILDALQAAEFDLVLVDLGNLVCPELVRDLKQRARNVISYNIDDPFGTRDGNRWRLYLRSVPFYDLVVVVRECNVEEARRAGAKEVVRVHRSSDEVAHAPRRVSQSDHDKWASEVTFIGTWMPERGPFMAQLVKRGIPLKIRGDRWPKASEWSILKPFWVGPGIDGEDDYALAIQCSKICLGLLSKGNRDLSTTRSFEIPHLGGVLCAERTPEHMALYREDVEAVFWNDAEECADKCELLLKDHAWRNKIARNGQARALQNGTSNEIVMNQIISHVFDGVSTKATIAR